MESNCEPIVVLACPVILGLSTGLFWLVLAGSSVNDHCVVSSTFFLQI